mgnify:CR=1 FL=1
MTRYTCRPRSTWVAYSHTKTGRREEGHAREDHAQVEVRGGRVYKSLVRGSLCRCCLGGQAAAHQRGRLAALRGGHSVPPALGAPGGKSGGHGGYDSVHSKHLAMMWAGACFGGLPLAMHLTAASAEGIIFAGALMDCVYPPTYRLACHLPSCINVETPPMHCCHVRTLY